MWLEWSPDSLSLGHPGRLSYSLLCSFSPPLFHRQRITGSQISPKLQYFGQSLSGGQDLTMDGLVDLAVGAQGHVLLLRWEYTRYLLFKECVCCTMAPDGPLASPQVTACAESWGDDGVHTQGSEEECVWVSWPSGKRPDCWAGESLPPSSQKHMGPTGRRWGWVGEFQEVKMTGDIDGLW